MIKQLTQGPWNYSSSGVCIPRVITIQGSLTFHGKSFACACLAVPAEQVEHILGIMVKRVDQQHEHLYLQTVRLHFVSNKW